MARRTKPHQPENESPKPPVGFKPEGGVPDYIRFPKEETDWGLSGATVLGASVLFFAGYVFGEVALASRPHPAHWLAAAIGGLVGGGGAWLFERWRRR